MRIPLSIAQPLNGHGRRSATPDDENTPDWIRRILLLISLAPRVKPPHVHPIPHSFFRNIIKIYLFQIVN
jgi:hypothetical protein